MEFFETDPQRARILNDIMVPDNGPQEEPDTEPMNYEELVDISYKSCYACENINSDALRENEHFLAMMKLYTSNATSLCKDAIFVLIKQYFDTHIKPELVELQIDSDWSLECIKEHFLYHTQFPTDEIITQLRTKRALRNRITDNMVERRSDGTLKFNINNIKLANELDKQIMALLNRKKEIPTMVGYSEMLDF